MTEQERKQKATAIIVEVLELLKSKNLTIQDAGRIFYAARQAVMRPIFSLEEAKSIIMPIEGEFLTWTNLYVPLFSTEHE